jgi:hypothetical protein
MARYQYSKVTIGLMMVECVKPNEHSDWLLLAISTMCSMVILNVMSNLCYHHPPTIDITNLSLEDSKPWGRPNNPINIVNLFYFRGCHLINLDGSKPLKLS